MPKRVVYWLFFFLIALVIVAAFYLTTRRGSEKLDNDVADPSPQQPANSVTVSPTGWQRFSSGVHDFSIEYPPEIKVEKLADSSVLFSLWGPTQKSNTEFYDGISLRFSSGALSEKSLKDLVENQKTSMNNENTNETLGPTESVKLANRNGYQFQVSGMTKASFIYLPLGSDKYLEIINSTLDPTNTGFGSIVAKMLESLDLGS